MTTDTHPLYDTALSSGFDIVHPNCAHTFTPYIEDLDENIADTRSFSNRPIDMDGRSESSKQAFQRSQVRQRSLNTDRKQFALYKGLLGAKAPKTFSGFRKMKASGNENWKNLQNLYKNL